MQSRVEAVGRSGTEEMEETQRDRVSRKLNHFHERLGAIRNQLAPRQDPLPSKESRTEESDVPFHLSPQEETTYAPIVLPTIPNVPTPARASEPRFDGRGLAIDALRSRELSQQQYNAAWDRLQRAEQTAAAAVQEADRLTEDARIAMVLYTKNERSWPFDERARRYQEVMQAKKEAEDARLKADDDRVFVQCLRSQLVDPYRMLRSRNGLRLTANALEPITSSNQETVLMWILASPLLTLPFTPRDSTPGTVLAGEKELSTHVVYYAATSTISGKCSDEDDKPPLDGWVCCSNYGTMPPPTVTPVKSSIETWLVAGAGAAHLNGKYLFNGTHNGTRKFKSMAGVELFRKELPKTSSIIKGVSDLAMGPADQIRLDTSLSLLGQQPQQLPSTLRALENNVSDFKSMERVGAWMSADTIIQKRRRMRDFEVNHIEGGRDGDHVLKQETSSQRRDSKDVVESRLDASAELCREWVLFLRCSRRVDQPLSDAPKRAVGLGCLKRHYYLSVHEKETMTIWAQEQEAWLERDVLSAIIRREAYIHRVSRSCQKCMVKFQQDLHEETENALDKVLRELNTIRFLTVKVLELIEVWRSHARRRGYSRYDGGDENDSSNFTTLGWSASITVGTGKKLFKGSHAFVSKFKRFCRPEDPHGQEEKRLVYLGCFATRDEAEQAYDKFADAEARRLNTTVDHLPHRRNVFRSCGKHFSVESEQLGPDVCIECAGKQLSSEGPVTNATSLDEWNPPFFFPSGQNYILKLATDLDFLDQIPPLKNRLNANQFVAPDSLSVGAFPLLGNVFLLPRTPIEDPELLFFAPLKGQGSIPTFHRHDNQNEDDDAVLEEALDVERIVKAQHIFLQEMQIYHPEQFQYSSSTTESSQADKVQQLSGQSESGRRIVQALYWDRCAALRIEQERSPLPFRQKNVWCRPDAGEWASLLIRGKHQQHVLFENRLAKMGKETQERRMKTLKLMRKLLKTPIYFIPSREVICHVIAEGEHVKGDVVMLEVKSAYRFLEKYDTWCRKTLHIQRWYRGVRARRRARAMRRALHVATVSRQRYMASISKLSTTFYLDMVVPNAVKSASRKLRQPAYSRSVRLDGELLIVSIHASNSIFSRLEHPIDKLIPKSTMCRSCARLFHVAARFCAHTNAFHVKPRVCCCLLNSWIKNPRESWMIRAYNPFSNTVYRLVLQNTLLMQLFQSAGRVNDPCNMDLSHDKGNPLFQCASLTTMVTNTTTFGTYIDGLATKAFDEWTKWRIMSDEAIQRRKMAEIDLDRARERVVDLVKRFDISIGAARRALDFTSLPFEEAQAWDPLENANDWRLLVQKRHTQKELASAINEAEQCRFELFQAKASEDYLRVESTQHRVSYDSYWKPLVEKHQARLNALTIAQETHHAIAVRAMSRLCTTQLTVRDTYYAPTRRALLIAPTIWHRTDIAMARSLMAAIPGLQRGRNTLCRRAVRLTDFGKNGSHRHLRLIVDVSTWTTKPRAGLGETRNVWVSAYDPVTAHTQRVYLEWELVQLLATAPVVRRSHVSERERWVRIANKLLSLCMLDRFTGEFTLRKLQFYHHLRLLRPQFFASRWFQDLKRGRKCGDGDEIFRQSVTIDGKLCFVVVYENWGDLLVRAYRSSSARMYVVRIPLNDIFTVLVQKPLTLHLWVCCVKLNQYSAAIITSILRLLRFTKDEVELTLEKDVLRLDTKSLCITTEIQHRRVLLRFRDAVGGDLEICAYDMNRNQTFRLRLEWENIRRVLKSSDAECSPSTTRRRNLTLTRNRRELCEWIASRLRFQNLFEHPDVLASSYSPLVSGIQVRSSFQLFNEWIATSIRNPLREISQSVIDKLASTADAALFHGLTHEQLALIAQERLPYSYDKTLIDTRDFIVKGIAASQLDQSEKHLKIDVYLNAHQVFARVRREIEQEASSRHEREEQQLMENEEASTIHQENLDACETASRDLAKCCENLRMASRCITNRLVKVEKLFEELAKCVAKRSVAQGKKKPVVRKHRFIDETKVEDSFDVKAFVSDMITSMHHCDEDEVYAILMCQSFGLSGTLRRLLHHIEQANLYLTNYLVPNLKTYHEKASAMVQQNLPLPLLRQSREDLLALLCCMNNREGGVGNASLLEEAARLTSASLAQASSTGLIDYTTSHPTSAYILPVTGAIEEIVIESRFYANKSFASLSRTISGELMAVFPRPSHRRKASAAIQLHTKRVHLGLVVFDVSQLTVSSCIWNPRATALALESVAGIAVFIPTREVLPFHEVDALYTALAPTEAPKKSRPSSGSLVPARRRTVQRSKQLLPWKQLSVERMQTARRLRQQRMYTGLVFGSVNQDEEREEGTLAVFKTSRHHFEWLFGRRALQLDVNAVSGLVESLRLRKNQRWTMLLEREHQLLDLFDETQQAQLVPAASPSSDLRLGHVRVEADDWRRPRRLIFSCQELQSRQQYFVDCTYSQLHQEEQDTRHDIVGWPCVRLPVQGSRVLALAAANRLVFGRKNGVISLYFAEPTAVITSGTTSSMESNPTLPSDDLPHAPLELPLTIPPTRRASDYDLACALRMCGSRRFFKHQRMIRHATAVSQFEKVHKLLITRELPREWCQMTLEDWRSQEHRGILTLDQKEMKKLKQAYTRVHQHRLGSHESSKGTTSEVGQWFMDVDKEMGAKHSGPDSSELYENEAKHFISLMERTKWWADKHPKGKSITLDLSDIAEWWRVQRYQSKGDKKKAVIK